MSDLVKTPERLKLSILNHALSGRLTEQLPSDGDAHDLLDKIINKKQELIKLKKIKRHKKLPKININEKPFSIPTNWVWCRFSSLYDMVSGTQPKKRKCINHPQDGYIRLYLIRDYGPNPKPLYMPINKTKKISKNGDILVANVGGSLGKVFRAYYGAYNCHLDKVSPIIGSTELNNEYIWYYLHSGFYQIFIHDLAYHKAGQASFNKRDLIHLIIPIPPLAEQHRIVQRLNEILPKVDDLNKDVVKLDQIQTKFPHRLKQSLLLEAMKGHLTQQLPSDGNADDLLQSIQKEKQQLIQAGKIRKHKKLPPISKDEIPFKIPKNWKWVRLGDISYVFSSTRIHKKELKTNNGIPFYRAGEIASLSKKEPLKRHLYISNDTYKEKAVDSIKPLPKKNDILIIGLGASRGLSWIVPNNNPFYFKDGNVLCLKRILDMNMYFIHLYLQSFAFFKQMIKGSNGTAMSAFNIGNMSKVLVPLPPLPEQYRIVSKLHDLFNTINA